MKTERYISQLENVIKQMLTPLKDIPFNVVIESLTGKKVIPFNGNSSADSELLTTLKRVAVIAGTEINKKGIKSKRPNEVGNYVEPFVKEALNKYYLKAGTPCGKSGKKKSTGYPDILFFYENKPHYLECKTYNLENVSTTQRSFYFSPSEDFKVIHDAHHFMISFEMYLSGRNIYKCRHYKILSLDSLLLDVKYEFNSDNRRVYSGTSGTVVLADGEIK